ncbi:hypothetical protein KKG82_01135, partial [Patescibacteria group bacterium]|nr:hypothetical protein [Patescibacteria group bacterium]
SSTEIAKLTRINRTTVYGVVRELIKKEVVVEDFGSPIRKFSALSPNSLENILQKEEKKLEKKKLYTLRAIRELNVFTQESKYSVPKIVFMEEEGIESHLYRQAPLWNKSMKERGVDYWGFQDVSFVEMYEKWIDWYWTEEKTSEDIELKLLSNEKTDKIRKKNYDNRQIRFWGKTEEFTATTWVMGDYIVMIMTQKRPYSIVEIHDAVLAHNMRGVFKGIWESFVVPE